MAGVCHAREKNESNLNAISLCELEACFGGCLKTSGVVNLRGKNTATTQVRRFGNRFSKKIFEP
ncbi:MAG: hypothetical protein CR984_01940 [Proteobacteria bacterium]|nr:MAG: hypothetical protein CR984_01940 [Pseudomonadota bacterium]